MSKIIYENQDGVQFTFSENYRPYMLTGKQGFETVENEITSLPLYNADGEKFISSRLSVRDIVIDGMIIAKNENERYSYRRELMNIINPKQTGRLIFEISESKKFEIDVIPEKAPSLKQVKVGAAYSPKYDEFTLVLKALDPYWRDVSLYNSLIPMTTKTNGFKFPLSITDKFVFGKIVNGEIIEVDNSGDASIGAEFEIKVQGNCTNPRIYNVYTQEFFGFKGSFKVGDVLTFSTKRGGKYVRKTTNGVTTNEMMHRLPGSVFLQIDKGLNYLQCQADSGNKYLYATLKFTPLVVGV